MVAILDRLAAWLSPHVGSWPEVASKLTHDYGLDVTLVLAAVGSGLLLRRLRALALMAADGEGRSARSEPGFDSRRALLFPYEAAYLAGGPARVALTALAAAVGDGWLETSPAGSVRLGESVTLPDPIASSAIGILPAQGSESPARVVRRRIARLREVRDVSAVLHARRLLVGEPARLRLGRVRRIAAGTLGLAGAVLVALALLGPGHPLGPTAAAAAALALSVAVPLHAGRRLPFRTAPGEAQLVALRAVVADKARMVRCQLWPDEPADGAPWGDVGRIVRELGLPPEQRARGLAPLWGREDALMTVALWGGWGVADAGLRAGLAQSAPALRLSASLRAAAAAVPADASTG